MIHRVSHTYGAPTLSSGRPVGFAPSAETVEEWGTFRIEIGAVWDTTYTVTTHELPTVTTAGTDYTTYRSVATRIESLNFAEPYGESTALIELPAVTVYDDVETLFPRFANVDIYRVLSAADAITYGVDEVPYWHGFVASREMSDGVGMNAGLRLHLMGALYGECALRAHQPVMSNATAVDIGSSIARAIFPADYGRPLAPFRFYFETTTTSITTRHRGSRGQMVIDYLDEMLTLAQDSTHQWTISRAYDVDNFPQARKYTLRTKPTTGIETVTVQTGGYGVGLSLSSDDTEAVNVIYGEGLAADGSRWRNAKYPMLTPTAPAHPVRDTGSTYPLTSGDVDADFTADVVTQLQYQLRASGYRDVEITGVYDANTVSGVEDYQDEMGLTVDGQIGSNAEWDAVWDTGATDNELDSGYFQPIARDHRAEPYTYAPNGAVTGDNNTGGTAYDGRLRVERVLSFPDKISKNRAHIYAKRVITDAQDGNWVGSITLDADPTEMSRFSIREGARVALKSFNADTTTYLFVSGISHSVEQGTTSLTVASKPYDLLDLSTRIERNREAKDNPAKSFYSQRTRIARPFKDAVGFDKEAGAGLVLPTALTADTWNVIKFVGAERGTVIAAKARTYSTACTFAMAVFGTEVSAASLNALIANPLADEPDGYGWWNHPDNTDTLETYKFVDSWGEFGNAAGYYPGSEGQTPAATLSGKMEDSLAWEFVSDDAPWLWLAVYPTETCTFRATLRVVVEE